jgi:hypothetical protein
VSRFLKIFSVCLVAVCWLANASADEDSKPYLLRYKMKAGESLHFEVTHVAKTKAKINKTEEVTQMHTQSHRHWDVESATDQQITFSHVLDSVSMTQQTGENEEMQWSSGSDTDPPAMFRAVADQIGTRLSTITIDSRGLESSRANDSGTKSDLGMGSLTLNLPEEAIAIGGSWSVPREVRVRDENSEVKTFKINEVYTLEQVKTGVATISIRSEALTPIDSEAMRSQVVQQMSNGEIRFDIDAGRMIEKTLDWDESVVSFRGPNSAMEYRAKLTEKLVPATTTPQSAKR